MYNELWRRTQILEGLAKDSMALSNATRRELQEGLRSASMQLNRFCSDKKPGSTTLETIEGRFAELSKKMGHYFQTLISAQHMFTETCHRVQQSEPAFEKYLTQLLEKIVDLITNKTCENEMEEVHELLKSHHSTVVRNVGHSTNTVIRATDNSSKEIKNLANIINGVRDGLLTTSKDILNSIANMHEGQINVQQTLKRIASTMTEFQDQLSELGNTSQSKESSGNSHVCPESTITLEEITATMKDLLRNYSKTTDYEEVTNLTQKLILLLKAIYPHIHQGGHKTDNYHIQKQEVLNNDLNTKKSTLLINNHHLLNYVMPEAEENILTNAMTADNTQIKETIMLKDFKNSSNIQHNNNNDVQYDSEQLEESRTYNTETFNSANDHSDETTVIPNANLQIQEEMIITIQQNLNERNENITREPAYNEQNNSNNITNNNQSITQEHNSINISNNHNNNFSNSENKSTPIREGSWTAESYEDYSDEYKNESSIQDILNPIIHALTKNLNDKQMEISEITSTIKPISGVHSSKEKPYAVNGNNTRSLTSRNTTVQQITGQNTSSHENNLQINSSFTDIHTTPRAYEHSLQINNTQQNATQTQEEDTDDEQDKLFENWSLESQKIYSDMSVHQLISKLEELAKLLKLDEETLDKASSRHEAHNSVKENSDVSESRTNLNSHIND